MTQDESLQIEELLAVWYAWQSAWTPALGAGRVDPSCRGFQSAWKQWLTQDERRELERIEAEKRVAEQVDVCVSGLVDWKHRAAIQVHMKNKTSGAMVFRSPRLAGRDHELYQAAKVILYSTLKGRGLMRTEQNFLGKGVTEC